MQQHVSHSGLSVWVKSASLLLQGLVLLGLSGTVAWALDLDWKGPDLSAVHIDALEPDDTIESRILLSRHGTKSEAQQPGLGRTISLVNRAEGRRWMLRPDKKRYAEILSAPATPDMSPYAEAEVSEKQSAVFNSKPCQGYDRMKQLEKETLQGRSVQKWVCGKMRTQELVYQWLDPRFGIVVRQEYEDGSHEELRDIKRTKVTAKDFVLPSGYRKVKMDELMRP